MSIILTKTNGIFQLKRDENVLGQASNLENLLTNVATEFTDQKFPREHFLAAAEVLGALLKRERPGQVLTYDGA